MKPPTLHTLLEDPAYRKMFRTIPRLPESLLLGNPWAVYAQTIDGRWRGKLFPTYRDGWGMVVKCLNNETYQDVSIVSRRYMIQPPAGVVWDWPYVWCSRCRRPSLFTIQDKHHALTVINPGQERCYFCGVRQVFVTDTDRENALIHG